jgi:ribosomal protein S18 acetylase RimI-like enzyme
MQIFKATVEHVAHVAPLFDQYRQFYGKPSDLAGATRFLTERLSRGESTLFFATGDVRDPKAAVAFVHCYGTFSSVRMKPVVILNDLFVVPAWRGREKIAERLCLTVHEMARERGAAAVVLETAPDNARAQALYRRLDYHADGMLHLQLDL